MSHITREAYEKLVAEDLAWLEKQPRTLERDHVMLIVQNSVDQLYGPKPPLPFYERSLDSFADEIITRVRSSLDGERYYAVLNAPYESRITTDFSTCRPTPELAVAACAAKIRQDHLGTGKYAPHACLQGYTLKFVLMKYWAELEQARATMAEISLSERQTEILQHAVGYDSRKPGFRNYFCASLGSDDHDVCLSLAVLGLMTRGATINGGRDQYFFVNQAGGEALKLDEKAMALLLKP